MVRAAGVTFNFKEEVQTWTVPDDVTEIKVELTGGSGSSTARGAKVVATLDVTPGEELFLYVAGWSEPLTNSSLTFKPGGWPFGGPSYGQAAPGAGLSAIVSGGPIETGEILAIAGGGGGRASAVFYRNGGDGGGLTGETGVSDGSVTAGSGGTPSSGGAPGTGGSGSGYISPTAGETGGRFHGGHGGYTPGNLRAGGGGGAGWYGGGGGAAIADGASAGGGGGSSYTHPTRASSVTHSRGAGGLYGAVSISWGEQEPVTLNAENDLKTYVYWDYVNLPVPLTIDAQRLTDNTFRLIVNVQKNVSTVPVPGIGVNTGLRVNLDAVSLSNGASTTLPEDVWWDGWASDCYHYLDFTVLDISSPSGAPVMTYSAGSGFRTPSGEDISSGTTYTIDLQITSVDLCEIFVLDVSGYIVEGTGIYYGAKGNSFYTLVEPVEETPSFALGWVESGQKKYETGVDRGVVYMNDGRVIPWHGLKSVDEKFGRSLNPVYFDGSKIHDTVSVDGFLAQVSAYTYPDEFEEVYGNLQLRRGVYLAEQNAKTFGFSYRTVVGKDSTGASIGYKIHIMYNIMATPDDRAYSTSSGEDDLTDFSWVFTTTPQDLEGFRPSAHIVLDTTKVSKGFITLIEGFLYGTQFSVPLLPDLNELLALIDEYTNNLITITDNGNGTWTATSPETGIIVYLGPDRVRINQANIQWTSATSYIISSTPELPG